MKCIDFDREFERYVSAWMKRNAQKYGNNMDVIEGMMPDIYMEFLAKPAAFLDGQAPQDYFEQYDDAQMLVAWLCQYVSEHVPVPDLLPERITSLGKPAERALLSLLDRKDLPEEAEMTAISLLREMESRVPMQRYVDYIAGLDEPDDKGDLCAEALLSMGSEVVGPVLEALVGAHEAGKDIFADILSNYPGDERIYDLLIERFSRCTDRRALYASYLAKLGDDRALGALKAAAQESGVGYLDYVEIVNAIEALGGERPAEREFSGDPYYESLKRL